MPVDPGNLMLRGELGGRPAVGLPGCARSPKVNGFDWVLQRLVAGPPVAPPDVMRMGAGGLLMEIPSRSDRKRDVSGQRASVRVGERGRRTIYNKKHCLILSQVLNSVSKIIPITEYA